MRNLLELEIDSDAILDHNHSDIVKVVKNLEICSEALTAFLAQEITLEEYLDLLETAEVNIDGYLETVETNLSAVKLL